MRPKGSAEVLEHRRLRGLVLLDEGRSLNEVARLVGSAPSSVMRWRNARRRGGVRALKVRFSPGRPPKLAARQRRSLVRRLLRGAMACGYQTELWTTARVAELIKREYGIRYHPDHVGRLLHELGWSHQKPERRALERNTKAIERWKREAWPRVKKTPHGWVPISSSPTNRASS
jgi:transposase